MAHSIRSETSLSFMMKVSAECFIPCVTSGQRRKAMSKPCAVCGKDVDGSDHHVVFGYIAMHNDCYQAVKKGEARGSLGEEVIPPELLARQGIL